jgi:Asp-tRNA(Asn)/Glu-tRNA(Gln) amidotransferase A subunit family amidase
MTDRTSKSAVARVEACLGRIAEFDSILNAFITVTADTALEAAHNADRAAARGETLGPLHGLPMAIKDCIDIAGVHCTHGSSFFADNVPARDAVVVERLRAAGAIVLGKANMHEFAYRRARASHSWAGPFPHQRIPP